MKTSLAKTENAREELLRESELVWGIPNSRYLWHFHQKWVEGIQTADGPPFSARQRLESQNVIRVDDEVRRKWGKGQALWVSLYLEDEKKQKNEGDVQQRDRKRVKRVWCEVSRKGSYFILYWSIVALRYWLVSAVEQSESALQYTYNPLFLFPPQLGHHRALSRDPCAAQEALITLLFYM